ncbi:hypothetical protein ABZU32_23800 [Sphaerisporangium sp. NPDC005288]|uniref:effector-associated constant component EACC1 n=1 Tax=Sphaerisporangium sp. NPDC005288 TaxID=3155114 RepID=UPI0033B4C236
MEEIRDEKWELEEADREEMRRYLQIEDPAPASGPLDLLDVLSALGGPTAAATVLVTWLRNRKSKIKLKITNKDGTILEFDAEGAEDPVAMAEALAMQLRTTRSLDLADGEQYLDLAAAYNELHQLAGELARERLHSGPATEDGTEPQ